jgi:hypothetical protein
VTLHTEFYYSVALLELEGLRGLRPYPGLLPPFIPMPGAPNLAGPICPAP